VLSRHIKRPLIGALFCAAWGMTALAADMTSMPIAESTNVAAPETGVVKTANPTAPRTDVTRHATRRAATRMHSRELTWLASWYRLPPACCMGLVLGVDY
jgi:hypothetical protein